MAQRAEGQNTELDDGFYSIYKCHDVYIYVYIQIFVIICTHMQLHVCVCVSNYTSL